MGEHQREMEMFVSYDSVEVPRRLIEELVQCLEASKQRMTSGPGEAGGPEDPVRSLTPKVGRRKGAPAASVPYASKPGWIPALEDDMRVIRAKKFDRMSHPGTGED
jgi:hypothetical protein